MAKRKPLPDFPVLGSKAQIHASCLYIARKAARTLANEFCTRRTTQEAFARAAVHLQNAMDELSPP
jgi:hypothetical protein